MTAGPEDVARCALRVAVVTRTGRLSGRALARAIGASRHNLCGIVAERRAAMMWRAWRARSLIASLGKYGLPCILSRLGGLWLQGLESLWQRPRNGLSGAGHRHVELIQDTPRPHIVRSLNSAETIALLQEWAPDVLVVANAPVLSKAVIACARLCAVNFHSGRLPEYGGVESEFWALYGGEREAWVTLHRIAAALDSGPVLAEEPIAIRAGETPESLYARSVGVAERLVVEVLDKLAAGDCRAVRDPGPARIRPWPAWRQRVELRRRSRGGRDQTTQR